MTDINLPTSLPVINIQSLVNQHTDHTVVAEQIQQACREHGFFYISGHGVDSVLIQRLEHLTREFFSWPEAKKMQWRMELGGRAWRGYFPLGGELTSNRPDWKEGLYLGDELGSDAPQVKAALPMHGANLFPDLIDYKETLLAYMAAVTQVGHYVMQGIALSLGLDSDYFAQRYTQDPLVLFRAFNYPSQPVPQGLDVQWGVGEHTDYGLLTILYQDRIGGLEVHTPKGWVKALPIPDTFVCNIGDMLDRMTGGWYRSTPHRVVRNTSGTDRMSFPLFFDPNFNAEVKPIAGLPVVEQQDDSAARWDKANVHAFNGKYGDYLLNKVSKVFPQLEQAIK